MKTEKQCPLCKKVVRATQLLDQIETDGKIVNVYQLDMHRRGNGYCKQLNIPIYEKTSKT